MSIVSSEDGLVPIFIKLPPENIVSLKFTLESYEGLGILRTLDQHSGEAVILAVTDTEQTLREMLLSIADELQLRFISEPSSLESDWLLNQELS